MCAASGRGTGAGGELNIFTNLYKNVFGANIKLVSGYPGTAEIMLAIERGELDGVCGIDWTTIKTQRQRGRRPMPRRRASRPTALPH